MDNHDGIYQDDRQPGRREVVSRPSVECTMICDPSIPHAGTHRCSSARNGSRGKDSDRARQHPRILDCGNWMNLSGTWFYFILFSNRLSIFMG